MPDFSFERRSLCFPADLFSPKPQNTSVLIAGIDEAGRGPWAGPVVAGAVIFPNLEISDSLAANLNDSKQLSRRKREALFEELHASNALIGTGTASVEEIDSLNILKATFLAMRRAVEALPLSPAFALVDGNKVPPLPCPVEAVVKGDALSLSIAAASVIAKVTRDRLMCDLAKEFPYYGWEENAGYGTKTHQNGLKLHGICAHHRKSYAPIQRIIAESQKN